MSERSKPFPKEFLRRLNSAMQARAATPGFLLSGNRKWGKEEAERKRNNNDDTSQDEEGTVPFLRSATPRVLLLSPGQLGNLGDSASPISFPVLHSSLNLTARRELRGRRNQSTASISSRDFSFWAWVWAGSRSRCESRDVWLVQRARCTNEGNHGKPNLIITKRRALVGRTDKCTR